MSCRLGSPASLNICLSCLSCILLQILWTAQRKTCLCLHWLAVTPQLVRSLPLPMHHKLRLRLSLRLRPGLKTRLRIRLALRHLLRLRHKGSQGLERQTNRAPSLVCKFQTRSLHQWSCHHRPQLWSQLQLQMQMCQQERTLQQLVRAVQSLPQQWSQLQL